MSLLSEFNIQLYSVRENTEKDFLGTLRKISEIGYTGVEFAGYGGLSADEMRAALQDLGLKPVGSHVPLERLTGHLEEEIAYNKAIGTDYIICPWADVKTRDDVLRLADTLNPVAEAVHKNGMGFAYHNHDHEFVKDADGVYLLDTLLANTDKHTVMAELDLYWISYANIDPLPYLTRHASRIKLLHLKQIKDARSKTCVDLPDGILNFYELLTTALEQGVKHFILEQEEFAVDAYVSLQRGYDHIMSL